MLIFYWKFGLLSYMYNMSWDKSKEKTAINISNWLTLGDSTLWVSFFCFMPFIAFRFSTVTISYFKFFLKKTNCAILKPDVK